MEDMRKMRKRRREERDRKREEAEADENLISPILEGKRPSGYYDGITAFSLRLSFSLSVCSGNTHRRPRFTRLR